MKSYLGIVICDDLVEEVKTTIKNNDIKNVIISPFASQCMCNKRKDNTVIQAILKCKERCSKILIFGSPSCTSLDMIKKIDIYEIHSFEYCFQMLTNRELIEYLIKQKSYIITPGWLNNWKKNIEQMGFDKEAASKITLLNTGVYENSLDKLKEFGEFVKLPYEQIPIGLDFISMLISNSILEWKLEIAKGKKSDKVAKNNDQIANDTMIFELLSKYIQVNTETEAIDSTINIFNLFFGPKHVGYISINNDKFIEYNSKLAVTDEECLWDDTKNGLILKIVYENEVLGIIEICEVTYPNKKDYYINLAIIIGKVCGLIIENSRKYERQKEIERLLIEANAKTSYILNSIHESVYIVNSDYKLVFNNRASCEILKLDKNKDIVGKSIFDFLHPDYREIVMKRLKTVINEKTTVPLTEMEFIKSDGEIIFVEISSSAIRYDGEWCSLTVTRDITERKGAEKLKGQFDEQSRLLDEALECDKLKTEFLANLSHELRTPLNVLFCTLQLLSMPGIKTAENDDKEKIGKYYSIMKQNCYRLLRLVNNLIDITKIDAGFFKLNLKNYNIISIIEDITLSVVEYCNHKGIEIIFDTNTEEKIVACDADMIERIILNLLSNAVKFTPDGGQIFVSIEDKETSIKVSVKDTGYGIPLDMQKCIFDRFVQVDKSLSRNREGSGIGLSLVKSLVELHCGTIWIESEYKEGTEFVFEIPIKVFEDDEHNVSDVEITNDDKIQRINVEFSDIYD